MTLAKKAYEVLILGAVWGPIAALVTVLIARAQDIYGGNRGAYTLMALLVLAGWVATEYILERLKVDTSYDPT